MRWLAFRTLLTVAPVALLAIAPIAQAAPKVATIEIRGMVCSA